MSKLEKLIQQLCPDGVEYKALREIADVSIGEFVRKDKQSPDAPYPVFNGGTSNTGFYDEYNRTANKIIISARGANAGFVNRVFTDFWSGNSCYSIDVTDPSISWDYLYYWLKSREKKLLGEQQKGGIPAVSKKQVEEFLTPTPPLEVQREIVRILDSFTELTAELTTELTARKKQYEYYRNIILRSCKNAQAKTLGQICDFVRGPFGGSLKKEMFTDDGYAVYEQQHAIYGKFKFRYHIDEHKYKEMIRFSVKPGDLIMSCSGTMGKIAIIPDDAPAGIINQALLKLTPKSEVNNKYLKYCFEDTITKQMNSNARGGAIKNVASVAVLKNIEIKVPSIDEQRRIVSILDRFDALCNDLTQGLPAEIEARKKQYEYYRDKLLSFKEA